MVWPTDQMKRREVGGKYLDLTFEFRKLVAV
jgi:hypothetical protein